MIRTTLFATLVATAAPALAAGSLSPLLQYTGQIRAQAAAVEAQAEATFDCPRGALIGDDVFDELDDLCRELERIERRIARPITSRHQLRRLERLAHELDEQACAVQEAVHAAISNNRFRGASLVAPQPLTYGIPGVPDHVARRLPPHVAAKLVSIHAARANRHVNLRVGVPGFRLAIGQQPAHLQPIGLTPIGLAQPVGPSPEAAALCSQAERLRTMTQQLLAIVCG